MSGCWRFELVGGKDSFDRVVRVAAPTWVTARAHAQSVLQADQRGGSLTHQPCDPRDADWRLVWQGHAAGQTSTLTLVASRVGTPSGKSASPSPKRRRRRS